MAVSLREKINELTLRATAAVIVLACLGIGGFWAISRETAKNDTVATMRQQVSEQAKDLALSQMLPELQAATATLLEQIRTAENLRRIELIQDADDKSIQKCKERSGYLECPTKTANSLKLAFPIRIADKDFGYLIKEKDVSSLSTYALAVTLLIILVIPLSLSILLIRLFKNLTAKEIPDSLDRLVIGIEAWLRGEDEGLQPKSQFVEFKTLNEKIAEVFVRHEKSKNQAMVGQLSSGILHDVRNDLQSVLAAQCLVAEQSSDPEKRIKRLENLQQVLSSKLPNIVNTIETTLDVNREIILRCKNHDVYQTVQSAVVNLDDKIKQSGTAVTISKPDVPLTVKHDPNQLSRVFTNLIDNALDSLSKVSNRERRIAINFSLYQNILGIRLEDNGSGIGMQPGSLFEAFKTTKRKGTGLGLFNAKKIITAHGGEITSTSPHGEYGACFEIKLPLEVEHG